jgi:hypothetical protein
MKTVEPPHGLEVEIVVDTLSRSTLAWTYLKSMDEAFGDAWASKETTVNSIQRNEPEHMPKSSMAPAATPRTSDWVEHGFPRSSSAGKRNL